MAIVAHLPTCPLLVHVQDVMAGDGDGDAAAMPDNPVEAMMAHILSNAYLKQQQRPVIPGLPAFLAKSWRYHSHLSPPPMDQLAAAMVGIGGQHGATPMVP